MNLSIMGTRFIESFEGLFLNAYKDQAGVWTIGYGTISYPYGLSVKKGDRCTKEQADRWLAFEVTEKCAKFNTKLQELSFDLSQNQYDALCSFFYNVGIGKLEEGTTMGDAIKSKHIDAIADAFLVYNKYRNFFGFKVVSKGLDRRRKAERELFLNGKYV